MFEPNPDTAESSSTPKSDDATPLEALKQAYAGASQDDLPLGGYAMMMGVFVGSFVGLVVTAERSRRLPSRIDARDIALLGTATHKLTRIVSRERITIPLRAPFTRYRGKDGAGLVKEEPRGPTWRRAIGNLLVCQYCTGPWIASLLGAGLIFAPRATRFAGSVLTMVTISDFLHQAYAGLRGWSK